MKRTSKRVIAFFLILVLVLSLCACAQKQQAGTDEPNRSADGETLSGMPDQKLPEKLRPGAGGSDMQPTPTGFSAEAEQSLVWLRERMAFPQTMFGAAFCTRFQLPGLSVPYLRAYSSLRCLWINKAYLVDG